MYRVKGNIVLAVIMMVLLLASCSVRRQMKALRTGQLDTVRFNMPKRSAAPSTISVQNIAQDTIIIKDAQGNEQFLMKAIEDEETGEMVATEVLEAATVTARFQNIAERSGKVDLEFIVTVPQKILNKDWQFRIFPEMVILGDTTRLDAIYVTGKAYRERQLKGYERYDRFVSKIVTDDMAFLNTWQFDRFVSRNFPAIYAFKTDSTVVSQEEFESVYGVKEKEAIEHYINKLQRKKNNSLKEMKQKKYEKYVKVPIVTEGIRLDSVVVKDTGAVSYHYVQTINTRPKLRKATINLEGDIYRGESKFFHLPDFEPLDYYISTTSSFADMSIVKYLTKVIERRAYANTAYRIEFKVAKSDIDPDLGNNAIEIERIKSNLRNLLDNEVFELDSIIVNATASPEGAYSRNQQFAQARSESVTKYFDHFIKFYADSLRAEQGYSIELTNELDTDQMKEEIVMPEKDTIPEIKFTARSNPENWDDLLIYVREDTVLTDDQKQQYYDLHGTLTPDAREAKMKGYKWYTYAKKDIYPKLRTVKFNFYLHRKGMVKDTVHTTVVDSTYTRGLQALKDMDYHTAIALLSPYQDYNSAVAFISLDRNLSALQILEQMTGAQRTASVNYMLAIVYSRIGRIQEAVQCYLDSVEQEPYYRHRGNLDPEISVLIKKYGLFKEEEEVQYW